MALNKQNAKNHLKEFAFTKLFVEELGWDRHNATLSVQIGETTYALKAVAEKRGMVAWQCDIPSGSKMPEREARRKIESQVAKTNFEHFIIFTDSKRAEQIWCWAKRETGKPAAMPEHIWYASSGNAGFIQKLETIAFSLEEEDRLSLVDVTTRARSGFDIERVTKRFYDHFKTEHKAFLETISGIPPECDDKGIPKKDKDKKLIEPEKEWYASLMLNRMMFIYFMQRKGFLNGERDYLRNRLATCQKEKGQDKFYSFYRYFLLRLFHEGLGGKARNAELEKLLGRIPYLNGGLFEKHQIEERYPDIQIPDNAFTRIFEYFDRYEWHLDERPLRADNEINPDVLGYIFEKYINQKQMGAYYTKEDITEYISKNTVIPFLFDAAKAKCKVAFENPGGPTIWDHLRDDPDRYIYKAVRHGLTWDMQENDGRGGPLTEPHMLPPELATGIDDVVARTQWNRAAPADFALPTEIWREVVARRTRYTEVRAKLAAGEVRGVNELITLNLDIRQFAQDVIERCEGPDLLRAFWKAIESVTVLDPTCGSGAFLFAALNILEPLYETCLERMEAFVADLQRAETNLSTKKFEDFKTILTRVRAHPNTRYFILKSIILNNLFGVDIMEEAVEICKLRLFLKLAAQVEPDSKHENLGIEPLPDIDFNIRAGNTLVGYASYDEVIKSVEGDWIKKQELELVENRAADLQMAFDAFRTRQVDGDGTVPPADKIELRTRLRVLEHELNLQIAKTYGIEAKSQKLYPDWLASHKPFHWFIEFHGIIGSGGFDVIVGNPPYLDLKQLTGYLPRNYATLPTKNLYSMVLERCEKLTNGRQGYIVPISSVATEGYSELQKILLARELWFTSFDDRPAHLFDGLDKNTLSILLLSQKSHDSHVFSSRLVRWNSEERGTLFQRLQLHKAPPSRLPGSLPRIETSMDFSIWKKLFDRKEHLASSFTNHGKSTTFYSRKVNSFLQILDFIPTVRDGSGQLRPPSEFKAMKFSSAAHASAVFCVLNSSLFRWFMDVVSDGSHLNRRETNLFPFDPQVDTGLHVPLGLLAKRLSDDLKSNSFERVMKYKHDTLTVQCIVPRSSKTIIDEIDVELAGYYKLTSYELDHILNYDIKYRLGGEPHETGQQE